MTPEALAEGSHKRILTLLRKPNKNKWKLQVKEAAGRLAATAGLRVQRLGKDYEGLRTPAAELNCFEHGWLAAVAGLLGLQQLSLYVQTSALSTVSAVQASLLNAGRAAVDSLPATLADALPSSVKVALYPRVPEPIAPEEHVPAYMHLAPSPATTSPTAMPPSKPTRPPLSTASAPAVSRPGLLSAGRNAARGAIAALSARSLSRGPGSSRGAGSSRGCAGATPTSAASAQNERLKDVKEDADGEAGATKPPPPSAVVEQSLNA